MTKDEDFNLLRIQTFILKVNIHCDGCKQEVKKLLQRIEGVYTVRIDAEHQKVTVTGNVDSATLIKRLARSGKPAELWSPHKTNNNQGPKPKQQFQVAHPLKDGNKSKGQANQAMAPFKNQQHNRKLDSFSSDDECSEDDEDEDQMRLISDKMNQINMMRQANNAAAAALAANAKKNGSAAAANSKGGVGNPGQNPGMKNPNGSEQKGINAAANNRMVGENFIARDGKRVSDMNGLMGLPTGFGGSSGMGFQLAQQQQQQPGNSSFPPGYNNPSNGPPPVMVNMQQQGHPSQMMMNLRGGLGNNLNLNTNNNNMMLNESSRYMQQPQVMYNRAPQIPSYTGYCHYYPPSSYLINQQQPEPEGGGEYGAHMFSDENTSSCVVM